MTRYERRFRRVARTLSRVELMRSSMDDAFFGSAEALLEKDAGRRFLDFYGNEGLEIALERYGLLGALRERGYHRFHLETSARDARHTLLVDGEDEHGEAHRLIELVVRRDRLVIDNGSAYNVLTVDWLSLRHPIGKFGVDRMRLPGQEAPGLGVGERVMELLYRVVDRLALDGLVTVAEYLHNAVLYVRELPFVDPFYEGQLRALEALLFSEEGLSFAQASWAMHWGYVIDVADTVVRWTGEAMVKPYARSLAETLLSPAHVEAVAKTEASLRYTLRRTAFDEHWAATQQSLLSP